MQALLLINNSVFYFHLFRNRLLLFIIVFAISLSGQTQKDTPVKPELIVKNKYYDLDKLPASFHRERREALRNLMPDSSVAVIFAAPIRNRSNDVDYEYHQDPDFYYLTGLIEPHSVLFVFKTNQDFDSIQTNELLFGQDHDPAEELWIGKRKGLKGIKSDYDITEVLENDQFADFHIDFSQYSRVFYHKSNNDIRDDITKRGDLASLIKHFQQKIDTVSNLEKDEFSLKEMMAALRQIKQPAEIELMKKAIEITCEAQEELMKAVLPGMREYETEAVIEYIFKKRGAEYPGFPSIQGGGENSCVLHYVHNRKTLTWDDLLVSDVGAEYHGYTADVTRTIPVAGEFSKEQLAIYSIVLSAQKAGIEKCVPGNKFWEPHKAAKAVIVEGLRKLGIINSAGEVGKYFMHGTSHYLGLDVHDVGLFGSLKAGNVITVEPGIYIAEGSDCDEKWWNIGVRIEDDILITNTGFEILSDCVPKEIEEIQEMMTKESLFHVE